MAELSALNHAAVRPGKFHQRYNAFFVTQRTQRTRSNGINHRPLAGQFTKLAAFFFPGAYQMTERIRQLLEIVFDLADFRVHHLFHDGVHQRNVMAENFFHFLNHIFGDQKVHGAFINIQHFIFSR